MSLPLDTIASLSQTIVDVYTTIEDELIYNIAKHFNTGKNLATTEWQIKKLAELGKLTQENINIIANMVGQVPELTKVALESVMWDTLKDLEPSFAEAVKQGYLGTATYPPGVSKEMLQALDSLSKQAINDFNLVNSNMLNSSLDAYRKIVANTVTMANFAEAQAILNSAAGGVVMGVASRQKALADAIKKMADNGITGFYDKAGKEWSPEAYINMTVRTTMTSTAHASVDKRMQEYDTDIFEVSSHSASRPMCEPYQGKLFSSANKSGYTKDLGGNKIHYAPASSTTMGQPAGLFGINCGHFKTPFIPGFSRMSPPSTESKTENDAAYKQSQDQRKIERDVKEAKREAQAQKLAGNQEAFDKAAARVKLKQDQYKAFCNDTGRTPRPDRLQVTGYDKKTAQDVKNANFKAVQQHKEAHMQSAKSIQQQLQNSPKSGIINNDSQPQAQQSNGSAKRFNSRTEADKLLRPQTEKEWGLLSNEEKDSLYQYTRGSDGFNRPLRGYNGNWDDFEGVGKVPLNNEGKGTQIKAAQSGIAKCELQQDMWFFRGSDQQSLAGILGTDETNIIPSKIDWLHNKFSGTTKKDNGFFSTGIATDAGFKDKIAYEVLAPKGTKGIYAEPFSHFGNTNTNGKWDGKQKGSGISSEAEFLMQSGTKFEIIDIKLINDKITAILKVIT